MSNPTATPERPTESALRAGFALVLFGGALLVALHDWLGIGGAGLDFSINGPIYDAVVVAAGLSCLLRARARRAERGAWLLIGAGVLAWAGAEIYWTAVLDGDPSPPLPSPADVGYLLFYPLAAVGAWRLFQAHAPRIDWRLRIDAVIAALGTAAVGAAIVLEYVADRAEGTVLEVATTLAYPFADIMMIAFAVAIVGLTGWRPGRTWSLLLVGLVALAVADIGYTLGSYGGLPDGDWTAPIYMLGAVFIGAEAWARDDFEVRAVDRADGWRELIVPAVVAVAMVCLFVIQFSRSSTLLPAILTAATMLAVVARLAISARENQQLLELVRTDALTGLGNAGKLQLDLAERIERGGDPILLMLLDLNGFKRYNDTFGHPAGDAMLHRLGGQLGAAIDGCGYGYRIGGDEFAVLVTCEEEAQDAAAERAASALSAQGNGFQLSAAWGAAAIPAEASDPAAAMQLADVRMYARKEARRGSREERLEVAPASMTMRLRRVDQGKALEQRQ